MEDSKMKEPEIKKAVREGYAKIASRDGCGCCGPSSETESGKSSSCDSIGKGIGYTEQDLASVPDGANLGLGCGNPTALASLNEGETVLDLGSGAGFDCFLAAAKLGKRGIVIGVDMTPEMIDKARINASKGDYDNVEFRLGEIENLPVADNSVDVVISNCVINLVPNKPRVFSEIFRVLKPGGRMFVSDIVLLKELPDVIKNSVEAYVGCVSGSIMKNAYLEAVKGAGLADIEILSEKSFSLEVMATDPTAQAVKKASGLTMEQLGTMMTDTIASVNVKAIKPQA
jgi:arsenite methyltransferase